MIEPECVVREVSGYSDIHDASNDKSGFKCEHMKKTGIYLDTSIINFIFADDSPEKQEITKEFFENYIKKGVCRD